MLWTDEKIDRLLEQRNAPAAIRIVRDEYEQRIAELETRLTTTETGEGWIEWCGGYQPVDDNQQVEIKRRDGEIDSHVAGSFVWWHSGDDDDIVAYRAVGGE